MCCPWWQRHEAAVIKMAYCKEERVLLVKRFCQTDSVITIQCEFQVNSECRKASNRSGIYRLVNKYEMTGSVIENKKDVAGK
jgi:hypothetical protein